MSDFLRNLRGKIGHDLIIMPAASVALFDQQQRILLIRLSDTGRWAIPGGGVEPGEVPADAAIREMWEESGIVVELVRVLGVFGGPYSIVDYPNGDRTAYVATIFLGRQIGGRPQPRDGEATEVKYFTKAEALSPDLPRAPTSQAALPGVFHAFETNSVYFAPPTFSPPESVE